MRTPSELAVPFTLAAVLALGAVWMPWGGSDAVPHWIATGPVFVDARESFLLGGHSLAVPNWTPALVAVVLALWAWLGAPRARLVGPAILYGLAHTLHAGNVFYNHGGGMIGAGTVLTFVAYAILAAASFRRRGGVWGGYAASRSVGDEGAAAG